MIINGQPRPPGNPMRPNPGGGYSGYTGPKGPGPGYGSYGQANQGGVDLNTGQRIPPTGGFMPAQGSGLVNGVPGHWAQLAGAGFNPMAAMGRAMPQPQQQQQQVYQPPPPPPNTTRVPGVPSHAGFNGVVAPTPGNGMPGFTNQGLGIKSSNQMASPGGWNWSGSGGGGQSYGGNSQTPGGGDPRPKASLGGGSVGTSSPGGGQGQGQGSFGTVGDALTKYYNEANAANEGRYQQLLGMAGQLSDSALGREQQREQSLIGSVNQQAISSGLGNTTVLPTLQRGVVDDSMRRQAEIGDQGLRTAMGIVERRTDQGPDYGLLASLAARAGSGGQSGYGYGAGGLLGGFSQSRHHGPGTKGGGGGLSNWPTSPQAGGGPDGAGNGPPPGGYVPGGVQAGDEIVDNYGQNGFSYDVTAHNGVQPWNGGGTASSFDQSGNPVSVAPGGVRYNEYGEMVDDYGNLV